MIQPNVCPGDILEDGNTEEVGMKVHHLAVASCLSLKRLDLISKATHLRTFIPTSFRSFSSLSDGIVTL